jgi:hypothetical protein
MPNFPIPEFFPEVAGSISHDTSIAAHEGTTARGSQVHEGFAGTTSASVTPATFGLGTGPVRVRSGVRTHPYNRGRWGLDDTPATHGASTHTRAGSSPASSIQAAGPPMDAPHMLEDLLDNAQTRKAGMGFVFSGMREWRFHVFHDEKLPISTARSVRAQNQTRDNRLYVAERVKSFLEGRKYEVVLLEAEPETLYVTNPATQRKIQVHVKLSSDGKATPSYNAPEDQPYLLAVVSIDAHAALTTMHLVPVRHEATSHATHREPADQFSYWRPWS